MSEATPRRRLAQIPIAAGVALDSPWPDPGERVLVSATRVMLSPVRLSAPTKRTSLRSARPRRRRKETSVDLSCEQRGPLRHRSTRAHTVGVHVPDDRRGAPAPPAWSRPPEPDPAAMTIGDRDGLIARIRQIRRSAEARERLTTGASGPRPTRLQVLNARVAHLEQQLEALQDSVHRESERHSKLIAELQARVQPGAIGAALAKEARSRGL